MNTSSTVTRRIGIVVLLLSFVLPFSIITAVAQDDPVDTDGDRIVDSDDNCAELPNPAQLDTDDDGKGDACDDVNDFDLDADYVPNDQDNCPEHVNTGQIDQDGDGMGDACDGKPAGETNTDTNTDIDTDSASARDTGTSTNTSTDTATDTGTDSLTDIDTETTTSLPDTQDRCPLDPNVDGDQLGDACDPSPDGDLVPGDSDGDFVPDAVDNCPAIANTTQLDTDHDGIGDACDTSDEPDGALVTVSMTAPTRVLAPNAITYAVTVTSASDAVTTVILSSELPRGEALDWTTSTPGCQILVVQGQERLMCPSIVLLGEGERFTAEVSSATEEAVCGETLTANAIADPGQRDPVTSSPVSTDVLCQTELTVTTTPGGVEIEPGDEGTYTILVENSGGYDAVDATLSAPLPFGLDWTVTSHDFDACAVRSGTLACSEDLIPTGASRSVELRGALPADVASCDLDLGISAIAQAFNADPAVGEGAYAIICEPEPVISLTGPGSIESGTELSYTIVVTNIGYGAAENVGLTDVLPDTGYDWSVVDPATLPQEVDCQTAEGTLTCTGIDLDPVDGTFRVTVTSATDPTPDVSACPTLATFQNQAALSGADETSSNVVTTTLTCTAAQACAQAIGNAGLEPAGYDVVVGSRGDDNFTADATGGADLYCGLGGDDRITTLATGDVFLGGAGRDAVEELGGGTFNGNDGPDGVLSQTSGIFSGGAGDDSVLENLSGGVFFGGAGNNSVGDLDGGTFDGGAGIDTVVDLNSGTFRGYDGTNRVFTLNGGAFIGGNSKDTVNTQQGGSFNGGAGEDLVVFLKGGTFDGAGGKDTTGFVEGGIFNGGAGDDLVKSVRGGTYNGDSGNDSAEEVASGTYNGGLGNDGVQAMAGGIFNGDAGDDWVTQLSSSPANPEGGTFNGGDGNDSVDALVQGVFNGNAGFDSVRLLGFGTFNPGPQP